MALINKDSHECIVPELELFGLPPTDTSFIDSAIWHEENPITSITSGGVIDFIVKSNADTYFDLKNSYIDLQFSINDASGNAITPYSPSSTSKSSTITAGNKAKRVVFPEQYMIGTMFKNVEVYLDDRLVSSSDNMYAYRAYLEALLSNNSNIKKEQLQAGGWFEDEENENAMEFRSGASLQAEDINDAGMHNEGVFWRFVNTKDSKKMQLIGKIHCDLFNQSKYIPGKHQFRIRFYRHNPEFCLRRATEGDTDNTKYSIKLDTMNLMIKKCEVGSHVREAHEKRLLAMKNERLRFPYQNVKMKFFMHSNTSTHLSEPNLCNGVLPSKVVIALVDTAAFNGDYSKNPLNFKNFGVSSVVLRKNGIPTPYQELTLDYTNNGFLKGYQSMLTGTGCLFSRESIGITPTAYKNGKAIYIFDIVNNTTDNCMPLQQEGKLSLDIKVGTTNSQSITILAYLQYESVLEISSDNDIFLGNQEGVQSG